MRPPQPADQQMPALQSVRISLGALLRWSAGTHDFSEIHHSDAAARRRGLDRATVHGPLQVAVLRRLLLRWLGDQAQIVELDATYRAPAPVDDSLTFGGEITGREQSPDGAELLDGSLWARTSDGADTVQAQVRIRRTDHPTDALPMERLRHALHLGEVAGTVTYPVQESDLRRFAQAHGQQPDPRGIAPPTYFGALDPVERRDINLDQFLQELPFPQTGGGNAFNEVHYERPIRVGDEITVTTRYTDVYQKPGTKGTLLFRVRENELRDAAGALVATTRCGHVLGFDLSGAQR